MRRRDFIALLGGAAVAWPIFVVAQTGDRVRRVGVLMGLAQTDPEARPRVTAFQQELQRLGWTDGRNIHIDYRWGGGDPDRVRAFAAELVGLKPDVIVANATPIVVAVRQETGTIPIVFVLVSDPVGNGFVENLARPGGNLTGFTNFEFSMGEKWLETLKEVAPNVTRVAVLFNPDTAPYAENFLGPAKAVAPRFAVKLFPSGVRNAAELERAMVSLAGSPDGGLIVLPDIFTTVHREAIVALAAQHRLPAVYAFRYFAVSGGLIAYGTDASDVFRQAASYVDRILRGERPGNLPVQEPVKFELVINLKTAKALGLTVPPTLLARADEVIE